MLGTKAEYWERVLELKHSTGAGCWDLGQGAGSLSGAQNWNRVLGAKSQYWSRVLGAGAQHSGRMLGAKAQYWKRVLGDKNTVLKQGAGALYWSRAAGS